MTELRLGEANSKVEEILGKPDEDLSSEYGNHLYYIYNNFKWKGKPEHDGAWLIKNSWYSDELRELNQPEECHHGYFWMSYDEPTIAPSAYVFDAVSNQDTENYYDNNYQYDEGYLDCAINNETNTITCANVYEVKGNTANNYGETLKAVSFETYDNANVNYKIEKIQGLDS